MAMQLIPFDNADKLPSYIKKSRSGKSAALKAGVSVGVTRLSTAGKRWTIVRGRDDKTPLRNPKDPEAFATYINLVVLNVAPALSRTFYSKGFDPSAEPGPPDCSSADGVKPDSGIEKPVSKSCAVCPHAVYGTGPNGKGFRCPNHRRLAVASPNALDDPMLLSVPGASLKNLAIYGDLLDKRGCDYDMVITKVAFDPDEPTPKLMFEPVAFLPEDLYAAAQQAGKSSAVERILGGAMGELDPELSNAPAVQVTPDEVAEALDEPPAAAPVKEAEPTPEPAVVVVEETPVKTNVVEIAERKSAFDDGLDALLSEYED